MYIHFMILNHFQAFSIFEDKELQKSQESLVSDVQKENSSSASSVAPAQVWAHTFFIFLALFQAVDVICNFNNYGQENSGEPLLTN